MWFRDRLCNSRGRRQSRADPCAHELKSRYLFKFQTKHRSCLASWSNSARYSSEAPHGHTAKPFSSLTHSISLSAHGLVAPGIRTNDSRSEERNNSINAQRRRGQTVSHMADECEASAAAPAKPGAQRILLHRRRHDHPRASPARASKHWRPAGGLPPRWCPDCKTMNTAAYKHLYPSSTYTVNRFSLLRFFYHRTQPRPRSPVRKPCPAPAGRVLVAHEGCPGHGDVEDAPVLQKRPGILGAGERQRSSRLSEFRGKRAGRCW